MFLLIYICKKIENYSHELQKFEFKKLVHKLPSVNRELLRCLSNHFSLVVENEG